MTDESRVVATAGGAFLVALGLAVGFAALLALGTTTDFLGGESGPHYAVGETLGAISVTLICGGIALAAWVTGKRRHLVSTLLALGALLFTFFFASVVWIGFVFVGIAVATAAVIYARVA